MKHTWKLLLCLLALLLCACTAIATEGETGTTTKCEHQWALNSSTPATCVEKGKDVYHCIVCGSTYEEATPFSLDHTWGEPIIVVDPTCTMQGSSSVYCTVCGIEVHNEPLDMVEHVESEPKTVAATCETPGSITTSCINCGMMMQDEILMATEHQFGDAIRTTDVTCTENGVDEYHCSACDYFETYPVFATGHVDGPTTTINATCTEDGVIIFSCEVCGEETSRSTQPSTGHIPVPGTTIDPTCTEDGASIQVCEICGIEIDRTPLTATGHSLGDINRSKEPTCTDEGIEENHCFICDYFESTTIPQNGHMDGPPTITEPTCTESGYTIINCMTCGVEVSKTTQPANGHTDGPVAVIDPTCTEPGSTTINCLHCGIEISKTTQPANGHTEGAPSTVDPTCTEAGYTATNCMHCDTNISTEEIPAKGHIEGEDGRCTSCGIIVSCTEHEWETGLEHDETHHWRNCKNCDATTNYLAHEFILTYDVEPTCTEGGIAKYACCYVECNYTNGETFEVAARGHGTDPSSKWQSDNTQHWYDCVNCGFDLQIAPHTPSANNTALCFVCGKTVETEGGICEHATIGLKITTDSTCATQGTGIRYCTDCGYIYDDNVILNTKPDNHVIGDNKWQSNESECWYICSLCNQEAGRAAHYFATQYVQEPTCTKAGTGKTACINCGYSDNVIFDIKARGHGAYDTDPWQKNDTKHWKSCINCSTDVFVEAHTPDENDKTVCSVCGATIEEEEELTCKNGGNHSYTKTTYNQDNHWFICEYCGTTDTENGYWYSHYTDCNSRNACAGCGANNVTIHVDQHYKWELKSNETHHWRYCATCDVIFEKSQHTVSCVDENLCVECKATGVTGIGGHDWDYSTIASDATHHWRNCNNCDARDQYYQHDTYCDAADPTICISCKATGVTCGIVTHRVDYDVYYSDDYAHWQDCSLHPGEFICNLETHLVTCADTTTCTICKATGIKGSAQHTVDSNGWQHTATECWYTCSVCKQEVERGSHILDCTNDTCQYCRSTGVQGEYDHRYSGNTFEYDETHHWNYCFRCKEAEIRAEHYVSCVVNSTTCFDCNAENVTLTTKHIDIDRSKLIYDDNQHWYFCNGCNGPATKFDHSFKDGVCTCGKTESTACSHKYAWLNIQSPTCTQSGRMEHTCTNCKEVAETKVTSALGHSPTTSSTAATCTSAGQEITSCSRCGTTMSSSSIPALGHNPMTSTTSATCTTPGTETTSCSRCGATISSSSIPALGHNPTTSSTPATCTAAGLETTSCTTCGSTISSSTIPALGHDYVTTTQDATCTTEGLAQSICTRCGDVQSSEVLPMISHDRQYSTLSAATCTNDGVREWSCAICGQTMEREPIPAKGHSLSTTETATATVEKCSRCDYEKVTPKATATPAPTAVPTATPAPTVAPTATPAPTVEPTAEPTVEPTIEPTVEPTIEPTAAPTVAPAELPKDVVVKPVENVVIEIELPVEEETEDETETEGEIEEDTEEEPQPEVEVKNVEISVNEVALEETPVVLPLPVEVEPAKVITIQMTIPEVTEEEKVAIPEKVKISLPVTEIEIESLANTKLVLVLEDGSMVEIPYELVDGKLVFTTTQMGVFAFIPME